MKDNIELKDGNEKPGPTNTIIQTLLPLGYNYLLFWTGLAQSVAPCVDGPRRRSQGMQSVCSACPARCERRRATAGRSTGRCLRGASMDHGAAAWQGFELRLALEMGNSSRVVAHRCGGAPSRKVGVQWLRKQPCCSGSLRDLHMEGGGGGGNEELCLRRVVAL
jgi:hypothetical protein